MSDTDIREPDTEEISNYDKLGSLYEVATHEPRLTATIVTFGITTAALEGIGLGFILPIIQQTRSDAEPSGLAGAFANVYDTLGIPFILEYIILGVASVLAVRYTVSFGVQWLRGMLRARYVRYLREESFKNGLDARISYFDQQGSDEILNAIITQTQFAGQAINRTVRILETSLVTVAYLAVATYVAPVLTVLTGVVLGGLMIGIRQVIESGVNVGNRVANANERVQEAVQAGMQGIRDVKLFNMENELYDRFSRSMDQFVTATVDQKRNESAIQNLNQFATAASVFVLIYVGLRVFQLSLGSLAVFLFAIFRLGPKISNLNNIFYRLETNLPHLIRTQTFAHRLQGYSEDDGGHSVQRVNSIGFEDVAFSYSAGDERVLNGVSFNISRGEFIGFVGQSGAGKSTIVSLLARLYNPDEGEILAEGTSIREFDISEWRDRISIVRQDPFIFNDTLRANITIGNREASQANVERVAEIAQVTEFLNDLPDGYDSQLGDDGVRLSGGQRQRVAIARALLENADLLILDEATSDLDTRLESKVHRAIEEMERDYGMIAIAHRLSTVTGADCIYTMDDGLIVESGAHESLVDTNGQYAELYASQSE